MSGSLFPFDFSEVGLVLLVDFELLDDFFLGASSPLL